MFSSRMLGVIGAGNMGEALIRGALKTGVMQRGRIIASRRSSSALQGIQEALGVATTTDNLALLEAADVILLCVKPQGFRPLIEEAQSAFRDDHVIISIMAGIGTAQIEEAIGLPVSVIRVMPNTPSLVGEGMSPYCQGRHADESHALLTAELFSAVGKTVHVAEDLMDAITATSGSGPAYLYYLVECMQRAAQDMGVPEHLALALVQQTMFGAAKLLLESQSTAMELRRNVTSPGGTTAAAVAQFEDGGLESLVNSALKAACKRAEELGENS